MIKFAIVGAGLWGESHAAVYNEHPHAAPAAICDLDGAKAQAFAKRNAIPEVYTDYREMLEKCDCDAIAIVTPDFAHTDIAVAAAQAGKHMLIEKPLATTREDVFGIMEAVEKAGVRAMVDLHNRWNPPFNTAKQLVESGVYGKPLHAHFRLTDNLWVATDMLSWVERSSILWFLGSHSLDTMNWIVGSCPVEVFAVQNEGRLKSLGINAVDTYMSTIRYQNGVIAQMENSWITPNGNPCVNDFKFYLVMENGKLDIDCSNPHLLLVSDQERMFSADVLVKNHVFGKAKGFAYESIRSFVDKLHNGEEFHVSLKDAANVSLALLGIIKSAKIGRPVEVERI
ncbi:MAG: Gfo/Idh/MocA family oxidoreductase [Clostridiales bacterium]|jgi:predicted dehydrogenase|nr:Gfo/Idh/MocA family oxidoreductase [Clostridiales bacterium]